MVRKLLDVRRLHALGWRHRISLRDGVDDTYRWFVRQLQSDVAPRGMATATESLKR
jgi:GDP-L-fucose synthase